MLYVSNVNCWKTADSCSRGQCLSNNSHSVRQEKNFLWTKCRLRTCIQQLSLSLCTLASIETRGPLERADDSSDNRLYNQQLELHRASAAFECDKLISMIQIFFFLPSLCPLLLSNEARPLTDARWVLWLSFPTQRASIDVIIRFRSFFPFFNSVFTARVVCANESVYYYVYMRINYHPCSKRAHKWFRVNWYRTVQWISPLT